MGDGALRVKTGSWTLLILVFGLLGSPLAAQEPDTAIFVVPPDQIPADTVPTDVLEAGGDTIPPDSLLPAPTLPAFPDPAPAGWAPARWVWGQEELQRFHGLSLLDLLRQIPSLTITRAGVYGRPAGISVFGLGGGRVRVFLDGYELDPLSAAILDLQRLALVDLREVRVERGLTETRIEITTFRLESRRPFSYVEAGTGNDNTRLLRALFSRPVGSRNVLTLGFDLVDTEGIPADEPFTATTGIVRLDHAFSPDAGVQIEYRQTSVGRAGTVLPVDASFGNLILRARARAAPGLWVDGIVGRGWRTAGEGDSLGVDLASNQAALRATYERGVGWAAGAARFRFGDDRGFATPTMDLSLRTGLEPLPGVMVAAEARYSATDSIGGTELAGRIRLGPWLGFSLFGTAATGARGVGTLRDSVFEVITITESEDEEGQIVMETDTIMERTFLFPTRESAVDGLRLGAEWSGLGATVGTAFVSLESDLTVPFGLPFDAGVEPIGPTEFTGVETYVSTPLGVPSLRLDGAYTYSIDPVARPYLPVEQWRTALTFHDIFYTGNLEPTFRLEALHRGSAVAPSIDAPVFGAQTEPYTLLNLYLQIRIIDVQAFLRWENLLDVQGADIPGRPFSQPRALYGVRWRFYN